MRNVCDLVIRAHKTSNPLWLKKHQGSLEALLAFASGINIS